MSLNNMSNTPESVEEHIRKQIEGSGIGQVMAQAILAAQKPMTLTQLAQKHNLEPDSAKAFLREWIEQQDVYHVQKRKYQNICSFYSMNMRNGDMLIARPTDLGD